MPRTGSGTLKISNVLVAHKLMEGPMLGDRIHVPRHCNHSAPCAYRAKTGYLGIQARRRTKGLTLQGGHYVLSRVSQV